MKAAVATLTALVVFAGGITLGGCHAGHAALAVPVDPLPGGLPEALNV
ncbi:hypothetical protein [Propioniciclava flava]